MQIHTTTTYIGTYYRLFLLLGLSAAISFFLPHSTDDALINFFNSSAVTIGILFAISAGFLMMLTMTRRQVLDTAVSIELNKIRRIHHLALHLNKTAPGTDKWFRDVDAATLAYLKAFAKRDFIEYEDGNTLARKITYAVYALPQYSKDYNSDQYQALLDTTGSLTEAREDIRAVMDGAIGHFQWLVTLFLTLLFAALIVFASPEGLVASLFNTVVIFNLLLMLQLIYEYDRLNPKKRKFYVDLYLDNTKLMLAGPAKTKA